MLNNITSLFWTNPVYCYSFIQQLKSLPNTVHLWHHYICLVSQHPINSYLLYIKCVLGLFSIIWLWENDLASDRIVNWHQSLCPGHKPSNYLPCILAEIWASLNRDIWYQHSIFFSFLSAMLFYLTSPATCSWVQSSALMFRPLLYFKCLAISDGRHYIWPQVLSHSLKNDNISTNAQYVELDNLNWITEWFTAFHFQTRFPKELNVNINRQE